MTGGKSVAYKVEWILETDLKNFFGSFEWTLQFVEHQEPSAISWRWLSRLSEGASLSTTIFDRGRMP
jgi:hypothetical protein